MQAILLCAGLGRRMQPLTNELHKSLLPVGDSTILGRIVDALIAIDVRRILVVTGYRADDLKAFLAARYPTIAFHYVHNARFAETNNIVSLAMALETATLDDDVLLIESDVLFAEGLLTRLRDRTGNVALVDRYRPGMDGTVVAVDHGVVTGVFPVHLQGPAFAYDDKYKTLNIYRFDKGFCQSRFLPLLSCYANLIDQHCYYELVLGMLVNLQREQIHAEIVSDTEWAEVDDPNDLAVARFVFEPHKRLEILERTRGGTWNFSLLDFTYLRNMHFPTDAMIASLRQALPELVTNYGSTQVVLDEKLAGHLLCRADRVALLNGASQAFPLLAELLPQRGVLLPAPTFGEFPRWWPEHDVYRDAPGIDLGALERRAGEAALVLVVNPNNPTGTTLPTAALHALAARHPQTRFVVDESFVEFSDQEPLRARLEREPLPNVVVLASLSKSLGVPGIRLGYVYTSDATLLATLRARLPIWNINALAEYFLEIGLKFRDERAASFSKTAADRDAFVRDLTARPWTAWVHPSGANFVLVRLAPGGPRLDAALMERHRIYIKDVTARFDGAPTIRLAVRLPHENRRLIDAIDEVWR